MRQQRLTAASALAALLAGAPLAAAAQDTTVVGSGGAQSGVTVNMGALDRGTAPARTGTTGAGGRNDIQLRRPDGGDGTAGTRRPDDVAPGEPVPGPEGRVLRFPPADSPRSRLTVDPDAFAERAPARDETRQQVAKPKLTKPEPGAGSGTDADGAASGSNRANAGTTGQPARGQPDARDSRLTTQGEQMARQDGGGANPPTPQDGARAGAGAAERTDAGSTADGGTVPETPDIPEAPSANTDGETQTADTTASAPDPGSPDPVTPRSKPARDERDTAGATRTADRGAAEADPGSGTTSTQATADANAGQTADASTADASTADDSTADAGSDAAQAAGATDGSGPESGANSGATGSDSGDTGATGDGAGETQTAKRTPADRALPGKLQLDFATGSAELSDAVRAELRDLAATLKDTPNQRIQLMAFAKGGDDGASRARRLSLSRALAVRSFLIDKGVRSTRMDVRALGDTAESGPLDRVDIVPANR